MDKTLQPPRMPRIVMVDRRTLPHVAALPKHPNEATDEAHDDSAARLVVGSIARWMEARKDLGWI